MLGMKRVFVIQNTPLQEPLPLSVFLSGLLSHLVRSEEFEWNVVVGQSHALPPALRERARRVHILPTRTYSILDNIRFALRTWGILRREHRSARIDILHCFYPNSSLLGVVLFKMFSRCRAPVIYDVRSPWIDMSIARGFIKPGLARIYRALLYFQERRLCRRAAAFVFVTRGLADVYREKVTIRSSQRVSVIPSGVDLDRFRPVESRFRRRLGVGRDEILICSVGGIAAVRRQDEFLPLFKEVCRCHPGVKLVFVGEGDLLARLKQRTTEMGLDGRVIFTGAVPHDQVPEIICACDFGLSHLPDMFVHRHNFSLKILEYLACGVPALASRIDSNMVLARMLRGVFIYDGAEDILKVLERPRPIEVETDLSRFSWPKLAEAYRDIYRILE